MRLILAHRHDSAAHELAARWAGDGLLLTPADLHTERMSLTVDPDGRASATLPSRPEVTAILSRLGGVGPADLTHVDPRDVAYAAAELDAFLRAWLLAWPGPVLNRPTTTCLNGPGWRPEQWAVAAAAHGLRVRPVRRVAAPDVPPPVPAAAPVPAPDGTTTDPARVTVLGDRWFGPVDAATGARLCALARHAGCTLMDAMVGADGLVLHAGAWPDVGAPDTAAALATLLDGGQ
jgi:hypothetical protein